MSEQTFNVNCGFFDAVSGDRLYSADEMNRPYKRVISNGVFATPQGTPSTDLQVLSAGNEMNIIVKSGEGLFGDKWFENPSDITIQVPSNTQLVPRRDSVIVQIDKRTNGRTGNVIYRTGTPSSNPLPPDIGTVTNVIEYRVANIYVAASSTHINQGAITDLRGSSECPWITSLIEQVDTSQLYTQWETAYENYYTTETERFNAFMESLTQQLTVTTNVITVSSNYTSYSSVTQIPINITGFDKNRDVLMVYVNRLKATPDVDYVISDDSLKITLANPLLAGQSVNFIALKSVVGADDETALELLNQISNTLASIVADTGWVDFTLESGVTSFDDTSIPAVRKVGDRVYIRGAVKNVMANDTVICTLPSACRPAQNYIYNANASDGGAVVTFVTLEVLTNGQIKVISYMGDFVAAALLPITTNFIVG